MRADVVICGAGIAGVAAAHALTTAWGVRDVLLIDERPPLTLTSDKSTEAYRNWWPGPDNAMVRLMNRSIDLLDALADATGNRFLMNRRGYVYATAERARVSEMVASAENAAAHGAGPLRLHTNAASNYTPHAPEGYRDALDGADLLLDPDLIQIHFPYLTPDTVAVLHARRCGWLSGQQLGMTLLEAAREAGARFVSGRVTGVETTGGRVKAVRLADGARIETRIFVNCAGPFLPHVAALLGIELPLYSERHLKMSFDDTRGIVPRNAPMIIWQDAQYLPWSDEERGWLRASAEDRWLLDQFPPGIHYRPEGGSGSRKLLVVWAYHAHPVNPTFPLPADPSYPDTALRGAATMTPGLRAYFDAMPRPWVDGGYYTRTEENRPLIGPLPIEGAFVLGALSGFGLMAAAGSAELLAAHITGSDLPSYADRFALSRYENPAYRALLATWGADGQL